jgi:AraC-like DNA-binding protein
LSSHGARNDYLPVQIDPFIKRTARVTTDQDPSRLTEATSHNLEVSTCSDSSEQTKQHVLRTRCLRSDARMLRPARPRTGAWGRGLTVPRSTSSSCARIDTGTVGSESPTAKLLRSAHEDIARLTEVLRNQRCRAALRGIDGVRLPIDTSANPKGRETEHDALNGHRVPPGDAFKLRSAAPAISAPIYDAEGRELASLELFGAEVGRSDSSEGLLHALIGSAARSMTERWFRLTYRRQWIVAALRQNAPHIGVMLAVDRDQRVVAADRNARQLLEQEGRRFEKRSPLNTFFQSTAALLRRRGYGDASITLRGSSDGESWVALVTAPDIGAVVPDHDARTMLHIRPRSDGLTRLLSLPSNSELERGLSGGALKRVEEHIDANLDSALEIDELAALVRMSPSHFTRSFSRSVGLTPHRYVIQCRVAKARELLAATDLSLIDIALNIGFSDQSHFSRRFQELVGVPPGAYRRGGDNGLRR